MMRSKPDEDDYWNSSKCRAFTFDDDYDELSSLKESKRAVNSIRQFVVDEDEDEDDMVKVSWSGEPIGSITWSIKETASSTKQEQSFPKIDSGPSLPRQGSGYSLSSLFKAFSEPSTRNFAPELRKPKSEYKDYVSDWSPEETVKRMQRGKFCSLETFRSLKDKMQLLDQAVCANDGNVITAVCTHVFLQKYFLQCKLEVLSRELMSRDVALRHYIHYLKEMGEQKLLVELFKSLGRTEDMALLQYREHLSIKDEVRRKEYLKSCISLPFPPDDAGHVQDHYTLLERQIIIEANDKHLENKGQVEVFKKHPRKASILNMPIITTLYYSCLQFPFKLSLTLPSTISEKQYLLTALSARAKLKEWLDVGSLFTTKNWLGYTKKRSPIGFHRVVDILHKNNAPAQVLQEYVCLVEDPNLKISLAQKYKCHDIVIDMYKDQKDRQQLIVYQGKVERGSPEDKKIQDILNNTQIRWKN
uniref:Spermatogenesis-defective protein 39 homolog n=1 Tax=Scleropages formosus TaxID=113540 RepID=A0A8C9RZQ0_SCLFO